MERSSNNDAEFFLEICSGKGKALNPTSGSRQGIESFVVS